MDNPSSRSTPFVFRAVAAAFALYAATLGAAPFAYVTRSAQAGDALVVVDTATDAVVGTIPLDITPIGVAVSPSGRLAYVPHLLAGVVSAIDLTTNQVVARIPVSTPFGVVFNPSGTRAFAGSFGFELPGTTLSVIDTATHRVVQVVGGLSAPAGLAISPDGARLYVANVLGGTIGVFDAATLASLGTITALGSPVGLAINASGTRLYASYLGSEQFPSDVVEVIDLASRQHLATIRVGFGPFGLALNPAGTRLFVANSDSGTVSVVDTTTHAVVRTIPASNSPLSVAVHPSGSPLYVINNDPGTLDVVDTSTFARVRTMPMGELATGLGAFIGPHTSIGANTPGIVSGIWWNSGESGWGVQLTQRRENVFATWYTYDASGQPKWYAMDSCSISSLACPTCVAGMSCTGEAYETTAARFFGVPFDASAVRRFGSGSLRIDFATSDSATLSYVVNGVARTVPITRYLFRSGATLPAVDYTDMWWNPAESGWGLSLTHQFGAMFLAWYVYDDSGLPTWYAVSNCVVNTAANGCAGELHRMTGPPFGPAFNQAQVSSSLVGSASLAFSDADNGTLTYTVNGISGSKPIRRYLF